MALEWYEVATREELDAVEENRLLAVKAAGIELALARLEGIVHAVEDRCPHMQFPLSQGFARDGKIICAWHHWEFDMKDQQNYLNPEARCCSYPAEERDGKIFVAIDRENLPEAPGGFPRPGIDQPASPRASG